jgi:hypothetical protein
MNLDIVESALILVVCVIRLTVIRALLRPIVSHILVSALILVMCVKRHSFQRWALKYTSKYIMVSSLTCVRFEKRVLHNIAIWKYIET